MTTAARKAVGSRLQIANAATPPAFVTIGELRTITPPETTATVANVTHHDSPADSQGRVSEEFIAAGKSEGPITASGNLVADAAGQLAAAAALGGLSGNCQICLADYGRRTQAFTCAGSQISAAAHGLTTGQPVQVASTGTLPTGLLAHRTYWVRVVAAGVIQLHATNAAAVANSGPVEPVNGSGVHTLQIGTRLSLAGLVTAAGRGLPLDGAQGRTFTIQPTGPVTRT